MSDETGPLPDDNLTVAAMRADWLAFRKLVDDGHTVPDAAELSGLSETTIGRLLSNGEWPTIKVGHRTLIPRFVFHAGAEIPGIREISNKARDYGWSVYQLARFLLTPREWIGYDGASIRDHLVVEGESAVAKVLKMVGARS